MCVCVCVCVFACACMRMVTLSAMLIVKYRMMLVLLEKKV